MTVRAFTLSSRALREASRTKGPVLMRGLLIACLFFAVWVAYGQSFQRTNGGFLLLSWIIWVDFGLIALLSISSFSAVITEEKELLALGLLRLAGFTPASIILGKSVGLLVNAVLLLTVQLPFCMLAITLGGVHLAQVFDAFAVLLSFMILGYGLAMFCSVVCLRNSTASRMTATALLAYHFLPPLLHYWLLSMGLNAGSGIIAGLNFLSSTTAFWSLARLTGPFGVFGTAAIAEPILVNLGIGVGLLLLSWSVFDVFNRNEVPSAPTRPMFRFRRDVDERPSHRCWNNALMWKDYQFLSGGRKQVLLRSLTYIALMVVFVTVGNQGAGSMEVKHVGMMMMITMCAVFVLELGLVAGRMFQQEVKSKTLGSLMALPQSLGEMVRSKVLGCSFVALPAAGFFVIGMLLAPSEFGDAVEEIVTEMMSWFVLSQVVLGLFLTVYLSVRVTRGAFALTLALLFLGNMIYWGCTFSVVRGGMNKDPVAFFGCLVSLVLCYALSRGIAARLRLLASED